MNFPTFKHEQVLLAQGYSSVAGCDEVGVGPLAGPVVAAACILDPLTIRGYRSKSKWYYRVRDSKTVSETEREDLAKEIIVHCLAYGIGEVSSRQIDELNIHQASLLAMRIAVLNLHNLLQQNGISENERIHIFVDGRFKIRELPEVFEQQPIIDGDALVLSVSAASIIAKVHRDAMLRELDQRYPQFGFSQHKGYNTKQHREAIIKYGITPEHRRSFLKNFDAALLTEAS